MYTQTEHSIHQYHHHLFSSTYSSWWREWICPSPWPQNAFETPRFMRTNHHRKFPARNSTCPDNRTCLLHCENVNGLKTRTKLPSTRIDTPEILINFWEILFYFTLQLILPTKPPYARPQWTQLGYHHLQAVGLPQSLGQPGEFSAGRTEFASVGTRRPSKGLIFHLGKMDENC